MNEPSSTWHLRWDTQTQAVPAPPPVWADRGSVATTPDGSWAAIEGALHDRADLARTLESEVAQSDAGLVVAARRRWGDEAADHLRGAWLILAWDAPSGTLTVARDPMGVQPAFYRWDGRTLLLAPSVEPLLAQPEIGRRVRRELIAELLLLRFPPQATHESFFQDLDRLPAAHRLTLRGRNLTVRRYWDPLPEGFGWARPAEVEAFDELLEQSVRRVLDVGADSIALSGGFDSVGLAAVAARRFPDRPRLHAASMCFPGASFDESDTQRRVAEALGMQQTMLSLTEALERTDLLAAELDTGWLSPNPVLGIWNSVYTLLLRQAREGGCRSMIFGTGGDEMLALDLAHAVDCVRGLRLRSLYRYLRAVQRTSPFGRWRVAKLVLWDTAAKSLLHGAAASVAGALTRRGPSAWHAWRARRGLPAWMAEADPALLRLLDERWRAVPAPGRGPDALYVHNLRRLVQSPLLHTELDQMGAWSRHVGLTAHYPFFDRDLVERTLRFHPRDLISGGRFKTPLRRLVARLLPEVDLPRRKVDFGGLMDGVVRRCGPALWARLGGAARLGDLGVARPLHVADLLRDFFDGGRGDALRPWLVLTTESWLGRLAG